MILCLDVGNTHIYGGVYADETLQCQFRYPSSAPMTSDQLGIFFKTVLRENELDPKQIKKVSIGSVVPALNYSIRAAFLKYFEIDPTFLQVQHITDLKIQYKNPQELGADRIANAIAAVHQYPNQDLIIIDLGTATTCDAITQDHVYQGGTIMPGVYISMKALYENTAKLSAVNILKPETIVGKNTVANIQSGLYFGHLGALREIILEMQTSIFAGRTPIVVGTGGFAYLFEQENIFTTIIPELVLKGLQIVAKQ